MINKTVAHNHPFVFRDDGGKYFPNCLVNFLLCIITPGIYLPWALMKCRRYIYCRMEVNGQPFSWGMTGGNIWLSIFIVIAWSIGILVLMHLVHPVAGILLMLAGIG